MENNTLFTIDKCPLCGQSHIYELEVTYGNFAFGAGTSNEERKREFERLLRCPTKNELFEAVLELNETSKKRITSVRVDRIIDGEGDGKQ